MLQDVALGAKINPSPYAICDEKTRLLTQLQLGIRPVAWRRSGAAQL